MKAVLSVLALHLAGGLAWAQEVKRTNGDEELKAAILKKVEERLKKQQEEILAEVRKMLDAKRGETQPEVKKQPGFLGIQGKEVAEGVEVVKVLKETAAVKAGLQKGDIVMSVNGKKVAKVQDLVGVLREIGAGGEAKVDFKRGGQASKITATLGIRKDDDDDDDDDDDGDDDD